MLLYMNIKLKYGFISVYFNNKKLNHDLSVLKLVNVYFSGGNFWDEKLSLRFSREEQDHTLTNPSFWPPAPFPQEQKRNKNYSIFLKVQSPLFTNSKLWALEELLIYLNSLAIRCERLNSI